MSIPKDSRYAVLLVDSSTGRPIGLLIGSASVAHARAFIRHFNRMIRATWPDRKAIKIPVL